MTAGPTMLVTGATGKTGSATALQLLQKGQRVRAFVHRRDGRSERLENLGAEVVLGSLEDFDDLLGAMAGAHRAYFCPPLAPGMLRKAALFAAAAEEAKLEVVVALSQWLVDPTHSALHSREKWLAGRLFERLPATDVVTVNPGNPMNLAQVQFPQLMQFNGGSGHDTLVVAGGIPLNMLPINAVNFDMDDARETRLVRPRHLKALIDAEPAA